MLIIKKENIEVRLNSITENESTDGCYYPLEFNYSTFYSIYYGILIHYPNMENKIEIPYYDFYIAANDSLNEFVCNKVLKMAKSNGYFVYFMTKEKIPFNNEEYTPHFNYKAYYKYMRLHN